MIVTNKATVSAFALALWVNFPHKVTGWAEHLNTGVSHQDVARGRHRYGRNVFELTAGVAAAAYGLQELAGSLENQNGTDPVVGDHNVVIQV